MLPDIDGLTVCKKIRSSSNLPIIMLTAKSSEKDILTGLKLGADDYVVKPFSPKELVARIESVLRRTHTSSAVNKMIFNNEKMKILLDSKQVFVDQVEKDLTKSEFNILVTLAKTPNKVFSRAELIDRIKEMEFEGLERSIDSHIKNLRLKIEEEPKKPTYIITVHGSGYKFGWSS
jgi:DNA-binding response OmpR family regulator